MNDEQLERALQSIGKSCFVKYFDDFTNQALLAEDLVEKLVREEGYRESGCITRISQARRIIANGRAGDALRIVASSGRLAPEVCRQAHELARS